MNLKVRDPKHPPACSSLFFIQKTLVNQTTIFLLDI